jgi:hypothetical protein
MGNCCVLLIPNYLTTIEISDYILKIFYEDYLKKLKNKFSFDTIYFSTDYLKEIKIEDNLSVFDLLQKNIYIELNKSKLKKYSFWNTNRTEYVAMQISDYLFAKLIDENYEFTTKNVEKDNLGIGYMINFDFDKNKIDEFKTNFFCDKNKVVIDIDEEKDKNIHDALNIKIAKKLFTIISNFNFESNVRKIIESLQDKIQQEEETKIQVQNSI